MAEADRTSIHQLVGKKRVWAGNWPGDRTSLGGRIRAAIAKVNIALMSASPSVPYEFTTDLRKSEIRREIRKHV
jgi:hypothetical protein